MKINSKLILISILLVAAFFRFYLLANVPPSASLDEVSIGWNAYSILQTGRDEFKSFLPILLRAYDDYRPALYVYFVLPFVKIFGLDVVSVRLPSVILSILSVLGTYLLVKEFFRKKISPVFNPEVIALCSAFLLAISPWHIYISRLGHEVNLGLSFLIFAVLFFLKRRIYLSSLFFIPFRIDHALFLI
ncbi:MAG: glycosyltransferase family 39 protein, partial [Patescibacteria group bacterium]